jgi:hypothetical protein
MDDGRVNYTLGFYRSDDDLNPSWATYETVLQQGVAYHNVLAIPPTAVELTLLFANRLPRKSVH